MVVETLTWELREHTLVGKSYWCCAQIHKKIRLVHVDEARGAHDLNTRQAIAHIISKQPEQVQNHKHPDAGMWGPVLATESVVHLKADVLAIASPWKDHVSEEPTTLKMKDEYPPPVGWAASYGATPPSDKPPFIKEGWATDFETNEYHNKKQPHLRVSTKHILEIKTQQGLIGVMAALQWWYENEYDPSFTPPKRWVWTDDGWVELAPHGSALSVGAVRIGIEFKIVEQDDKPTGLPKTSVNIKTLMFVDPDRPALERTWAWAPTGYEKTTGKKKYRWFSIYPGSAPTHHLHGVLAAVIGREKTPPMTYKTMLAFGVKTLDQGPSYKALKKAVIVPGGDVLQTAVAVAQAMHRIGGPTLHVSPAGFQDWQPAIKNVLSGQPVYDTGDSCTWCDALPFEHVPLRCSECLGIVCPNHYDLEVGACAECVEGMPTCPGCDKKVSATHYVCEYNDECVHAADWNDYEVQICDNCATSVAWDEIEYVCPQCYQAHKAEWNVGGGAGRRGQSSQPPWEERGVKVTVPDASQVRSEDGGSHANDWKKVWGFDSQQFDPVQIAADFYLLHPLEHNSLCAEVSTDLRVLSEEAANLRAQVVRMADDLFIRYCDMVCGGELRHHRAVGGRVINGSRPIAWAGWHKVRDKVGPDALLDAAKLFCEMGGSYGGPNWAQVCKVLHMRETGRISPEVFVDRVFNLEHNGGAIISGKVEWKGFARQDQNAIKMYVGPAHAQHPARLDILAVFASRDALTLWADYVPVLNRLRRMHGQHQIRRLPTAAKADSHRDWATDVSTAVLYKTPIEEVRAARGPHIGSKGMNVANTKLHELQTSGKLRIYAL